MKKWGRLLFVLLSIIVIIVIFETSEALAQLPDVCQEPENILANCNFDNGMEHWQTFIEAGHADFTILYGGGECHAPLCPAAHIVTDDHFVGGLYQQVSVTPGNAYYANIIWLVFDSFANDSAVNGTVGGIGRRVGIDPFGGTDSRSPDVVWSQDNWRNDCKICGVEEVSATAQADKITVFLRIDDTWRLRAAEKGFPVPPSKDQFWLDDLGLKQIGAGEGPGGQEAAEPTEPPPPPTDTPPPPPPATSETESLNQTTALTGAANEPAQAGVVAADSPVETEETSETEEADSAEEASVAETEEAGPSSETPPSAPAKTVAPPPTLTPTHTPPPTATPVAQFVAGSTPAPDRQFAAPQPLASPISSRQDSSLASLLPSASSMEMMGLVGTLGCMGAAFVLIIGLVFLAATWLYRLGWGDIDDEAEIDGAFDDIEIVEAEIVE